jgi:hypothetical protein
VFKDKIFEKKDKIAREKKRQRVQNKNGRDDILKEVNQNRKLRVLNIN